MQVGVGQQGQEARALDGRRQLALVAGLGAGDARRHDLGVFGDEILEDLDVLVIDLFDLFGGKAAELASLEQIITTLVVFLLQTCLAFGFKSHFVFLP